jgi:predicted GIY-YIG superfamily endonuclease
MKDERSMAFWVYILRCRDKTYSVGHTDDLDQRMAQHQSGELRGYTLKRRPVELVYSQDFSTRDEALAAERQLKGWSRAKKEALIRRDWDELRRLSRGRSAGGGHPSTSSG